MTQLDVPPAYEADPFDFGMRVVVPHSVAEHLATQGVSQVNEDGDRVIVPLEPVATKTKPPAAEAPADGRTSVVYLRRIVSIEEAAAPIEDSGTAVLQRIRESDQLHLERMIRAELGLGSLATGQVS